VPSPVITSVSTSSGPSHYASESGTSTITIRGRGFNYFTLNAVYFGSASAGQYSQYDEAPEPSYITGTEIQVTAPAQNPSTRAMAIPVTTWTLAGYSHQAASKTEVVYAGTPVVSHLSRMFAPAAGGAQVTVSGGGMGDAILAELTDVTPPPGPTPPFSFATIYPYSIANDTTVHLLTPGTDPGYVYLELCTVSGCSQGDSDSEMTIYPPGKPSVTSSSPAEGPAQGGKSITIHGINIGCVTGVRFGSQPAATFSNVAALLSCGATDEVTASAPPGTPGQTVNLTLTTAESQDTGAGATATTPAARFTYQTSPPSAPRDLDATRGAHSVSLKWNAPASTGGDPVTGYTVTYYALGQPATVDPLSAGTFSTEVSGLTAGQRYVFVVTAASSLGAGLPAKVVETARG